MDDIEQVVETSAKVNKAVRYNNSLGWIWYDFNSFQQCYHCLCFKTIWRRRILFGKLNTIPVSPLSADERKKLFIYKNSSFF